MTRFLFGFWMIAMTFQSTAINLNGNPIFIYSIAQVVLIGAAALQRPQRIDSTMRTPLRLGGIFLALAVAGAFFLPMLFAGMPAFVPRITIDEQVLDMNPVQFTSSNVAQALYLLLNATLLIFAAQGRLGNLAHVFRKVAPVAALICLVSMVFDYLSVGIWVDSLKELLRNNEAGAVFEELAIGDIQRVSGVFSEPSYAGIFSSTLAAYFFSLFAQEKRFADALLGIAMWWCAVITTSFLGFAGLMIGAILVGATYPRIRKILLILAPFLLIGVWIFVSSEFFESVYLDKVDSLSTFNRLSSDLRSFEMLTESDFLGVGLGSHRASSLFSTIFASTGIVGGLLYLFVNFKLLRVGGLPGRPLALLLYCVCCWILMLLGDAEISSPFYWTGLVALVSCRNAPSNPIVP